MNYQDIKLIPDAECNLAFLRNKIYQKLHKAIFDLSTTEIGVSFANSKENQKNTLPNILLGDTIRIHSNQAKLQQLQNLNWLGGLAGYCKISDVLPVPDNIKGYRVISRIRQSMTEYKLKQRIEYKKNNGDLKPDTEVQEYKKQYLLAMFKTGLSNPYLELQSTSTGSKYRLYIEFSKVQDNAVVGDFNNFGLSSKATVPIFTFKE
jgi:CRISPR-associated endonuclease Csy4